jgi:glutamine synthetase
MIMHQHHLVWPPEALSVRKMLKNPSKPKNNFGVLVNVIGDDGKLVHGQDGKILKRKIQMWNGWFKDGTEQEFYFLDGTDTHRAGLQCITKEGSMWKKLQ